MDNQFGRLTIISDNNAKPPFTAEHGFALAIEYEGKLILFDTGQSALTHNAGLAGLDLKEFDTLVLSHGHYDHTGGVAQIISCNPRLHVYAHRKVFAPHFSRKEGIVRDIAMPQASSAALASHDQSLLHLITAQEKISENIWIFGDIPRVNCEETVADNLFADAACLTPDPIDDELIIALTTPQGAVIITGCCHSGIINCCEHIMRQIGTGRVHMVIGGLHLNRASHRRISDTGRYLNERADMLLCCHCTGSEAIRHFNTLPNLHVEEGFCGKTISL